MGYKKIRIYRFFLLDLEGNNKKFNEEEYLKFREFSNLRIK
jgi:hypothetical protein